MALLKTKFKFSLPETTGNWQLVVHELLKGTHRQHFILTRNDEIILDEIHEAGPEVIIAVRTLPIPSHELELDFGAVSLTKYALIIRREDEILWRSSDKAFRKSSKFDDAIKKMETKQASEEQKAMLERQKKLWPSIIVDISFGVLFFFVAREFGLVTAALTGAGATLVLFAVQPFTKYDLLGGFAVFGVVMSLISAGFAWGFQDDLAVKLRGTWMALIGAGFGLYDAFVLNGGYLGKRMAMYMEGIGKLNHKRASIALVGSTLILMGIDTPLAFILTTDQWIWYNSVFDMFIAIPIVLGCMFWAREKPKADISDPETLTSQKTETV